MDDKLRSRINEVLIRYGVIALMDESGNFCSKDLIDDLVVAFRQDTTTEQAVTFTARG